ncbi:hypothetical protein P692DRAFT_20840599 [Suillus brevipes Sb2]|nr:hypothetical protein P692DRAFT_201797008 [Suillus brevipes Sb2]KAG2754092.1 hypothetical protein P692DRAFT_20840599 [Suillus brevipes Sb2]
MPTPVSQAPVVLRSESVPSSYPPTQVDGEGKATVFEAEVDRLNGELHVVREKIRNIELQVEGLKANAKTAAQALMEA